jgi:hypothetical protein
MVRDGSLCTAPSSPLPRNWCSVHRYIAPVTIAGGGAFIGAGGLVTLTNCTFVDNDAGRFGGGLCLGSGGSGATCALLATGCVFWGNDAAHSGSQMHNTCGGDVFVTDSVFSLGNDGSQVNVWWGVWGLGGGG